MAAPSCYHHLFCLKVLLFKLLCGCLGGQICVLHWLSHGQRHHCLNIQHRNHLDSSLRQAWGLPYHYHSIFLPSVVRNALRPSTIQAGFLSLTRYFQSPWVRYRARRQVPRKSLRTQSFDWLQPYGWSCRFYRRTWSESKSSMQSTDCLNSRLACRGIKVHFCIPLNFWSSVRAMSHHQWSNLSKRGLLEVPMRDDLFTPGSVYLKEKYDSLLSS